MKPSKVTSAKNAILTSVMLGVVSSASAHSGGILTEKNNANHASFDIVHTKISTKGNQATFHIVVSDQAGKVKPTPTGKLAGSDVFSYVWPTTLDSYSVGFEHNAGILALAVTSHPDFDDTPLYDENGDGNNTNDGNVWHNHWVVLQPNEACGPGALGVVDIPKDANPRLPETWPGLPILIDSPDLTPVFNGDTVEVKVNFSDVQALNLANYDGVTSGLRVNQSAHSPLLCVVDVFDVASGDLSLPGKVNHSK